MIHILFFSFLFFQSVAYKTKIFFSSKIIFFSNVFFFLFRSPLPLFGLLHFRRYNFNHQCRVSHEIIPLLMPVSQPSNLQSVAERWANFGHRLVTDSRNRVHPPVYKPEFQSNCMNTGG